MILLLSYRVIVMRWFSSLKILGNFFKASNSTKSVFISLIIPFLDEREINTLSKSGTGSSKFGLLTSTNNFLTFGFRLTPLFKPEVKILKSSTKSS